MPAVEVPREQIEGFCVRNRIRKLSLFGSILTPRFRADSDIDVLVEFEQGHVPGLFGLGWSGNSPRCSAGRPICARPKT